MSVPHEPPEAPPSGGGPASGEGVGPTFGPQISVRGTQAFVCSPLAVLNVVHALSLEHSFPLGQSGAQYVSEANCAQTEPGAQSCLVTHGTQRPAFEPLEASLWAPPELLAEASG